MKLSKHRVDNSIGFNMTPMIDIVFLLIIFFMTVSQITKVVDHPLELPTVVEGGQQNDPLAFTVNVDRKGQIVISETDYSLGQFLLFVDEQMANVQDNPDNLRVRIRVDRQCKSNSVNAILRELTELGITQVRVAIRGER